MALIVTALHAEAVPFIEYWGLRRQVHHRAFQLFRGENEEGPLELIVTGIGKMRSAIGTAIVAASDPSPTPILVNVGVCAATPRHPIGTLHYVNRVRDYASGEGYFPDVIVAHRYPEGNLTTFDTPVRGEPPNVPELGLVDMEGSGFAGAASLYTAPSAWALLKVVSDHFTPETLTKEVITQLIAPHVEGIDALFRSLAAAHRADKFTFSPEDKTLLEQFLGTYRLTASQRRILTTAAREYVLRTSAGLGVLKRFLHREPSSKAELKAIFQEAHRALIEA